MQCNYKSPSMSKIIVNLDHLCLSEISEKGIYFSSFYQQPCSTLSLNGKRLQVSTDKLQFFQFLKCHL